LQAWEQLPKNANQGDSAMLPKQALLFLVGTAFLAASSESPGTPPWRSLYQQATAAAQRGSFEYAATLLHAALETLPNVESSAAVILWNELGTVHHNSRQLTEAEKDLKHALAIDAKLVEPDYGETAAALNILGAIAGERHDTGRAEMLLREAKGMLEKGNRTPGRTAALVQVNLALTMAQEGRYLEAGPLFKEAAVNVESSFGERSIEYALTLTHRALFEFQTGLYRQAIADGRLAVSIERTLPYVGNLDRVVNLNNLGLALTATGMLAEAKSPLTEAMQLEKNMPDGDEQLVCSLNNLAAIDRREGHLQQAKAKELRVLNMKAQGVAVDDLTFASVLNTLGTISTSEHNFREARSRFAQARELLETATGPRRVPYAATLSNIAAVESAQRHFKKAEALYRKSLEIDELQLGPDHPAVASDEANIAAELFYQKHVKGALELYAKAKTTAEARLGPSSPETAHIWRNMAVAYYADKQFTQAVYAYQKAVEGLDSFSGDKDPSLTLWLREYATALRKQQRWADAEAAETRALGIEVRNTLAGGPNEQPVGVQQNRGKT
jgi:tetratricopeptide (TPR) repeat protein